MQKILIFIFLLPLFVQCSFHKKVVGEEQMPKKNDKIEFKVEKEIRSGDPATFEFINNSQNSITIFGPWLKNIEKFEDGKWRKVRILYCPCGANCIAPPRTLILQPTEKHVINWNQLESWCGKMQENGIQLTIENKSTIGLYRILIEYSFDGINKLSLTKEFKIIN